MVSVGLSRATAFVLRERHTVSTRRHDARTQPNPHAHVSGGDAFRARVWRLLVSGEEASNTISLHTGHQGYRSWYIVSRTLGMAFVSIGSGLFIWRLNGRSIRNVLVI